MNAKFLLALSERPPQLTDLKLKFFTRNTSLLGLFEVELVFGHLSILGAFFPQFADGELGLLALAIGQVGLAGQLLEFHLKTRIQLAQFAVFAFQLFLQNENLILQVLTLGLAVSQTLLNVQAVVFF